MCSAGLLALILEARRLISDCFCAIIQVKKLARKNFFVFNY